MTGKRPLLTLCSLVLLASIGCDSATTPSDAQKAAAQAPAGAPVGNAELGADGKMTANGVTVDNIAADGQSATVTDARGAKIEADASGAGKVKVGDLEVDGAGGGTVKAPGLEVDGANGGKVKVGGVEVDGNTGKVKVGGVTVDADKDGDEPKAAAKAGAGIKASGGSCTAGGCKQACREGGSFSCIGGNCQQTAESGDCNASCDGGNCTQTCKPGATCSFSCNGGGCTRSGAAKKTCVGGGCTG